MSPSLIGFFFIILSMILMVMLTFLYRISVIIGRLDRKLEQLSRHLRDLNLYELFPEEANVLAGETASENTTRGDSADSSSETDATPSNSKIGNSDSSTYSPE